MDKDFKKFFGLIRFPLILLAIIWIVFLLDLLPSYDYGLYPRRFDGLDGIFTAPLIHSNLQHITSNSVPLLFLCSILVIFYKKIAVPTFVTIYILTGAAVWFFARPASHVGASGVVYGLVSFIFWSGVFRRDLKSIVLALVITVMYSGYFYGILPNKEDLNISWESHLFGALVGIFVAFVFRGIGVEKKEEVMQEAEEEAYLFPRDLFDKTKYEREIDDILSD